MQGPDPVFEASRALLTRSFGIQPLNSTAMSTAGLSRRFVEALGKSIGVIGASEIGDKTFFIAAIMAMRSSRWTVSC